MGYGDALLMTGMARGARARGKRIAFGDRSKIMWGKFEDVIFQGNPNVAPPGSENDPDIEWIEDYPAHRLYHLTPQRLNGRWNFDMSYRPKRGELFFSDEERAFAERIEPGFIMLEPNVRRPKQWIPGRWQQLATTLKRKGHRVAQCLYGGWVELEGVETIRTPSIRHGLAVLARASAAVMCEGGFHHGAAAVNVPAVVLFAGHTHPQTTGYEGHINLYGGGEPCGTIADPCDHCRAIMETFTPIMIADAIKSLLDEDRPAAAG